MLPCLQEEVSAEEVEEDDATWAKNVTAGKLSKGDKLMAVDHATIEYPHFRRNFYIEVRHSAAAAVAALTVTAVWLKCYTVARAGVLVEAMAGCWQYAWMYAAPCTVPRGLECCLTANTCHGSSCCLAAEATSSSSAAPLARCLRSSA